MLLRRNQRIWPLELLDATEILLRQSQQHLILPLRSWVKRCCNRASFYCTNNRAGVFASGAEELADEVLQRGQLLGLNQVVRLCMDSTGFTWSRAAHNLVLVAQAGDPQVRDSTKVLAACIMLSLLTACFVHQLCSCWALRPCCCPLPPTFRHSFMRHHHPMPYLRPCSHFGGAEDHGSPHSS